MTNSSLRRQLTEARLEKLSIDAVMDDRTSQQDYREFQAERDFERHLLDAANPERDPISFSL